MRKSNTKSNTYRNMLGRVIPKNYMVHIQFIFKKKHILRIENNVSNNDSKERPTYRKNVSKN